APAARRAIRGARSAGAGGGAARGDRRAARRTADGAGRDARPRRGRAHRGSRGDSVERTDHGARDARGDPAEAGERRWGSRRRWWRERRCRSRRVGANTAARCARGGARAGGDSVMTGLTTYLWKEWRDQRAQVLGYALLVPLLMAIALLSIPGMWARADAM